MGARWNSRAWQLYSVQQIADQLGGSRSPAPEGVLAVAEAGLVRVTRNRGFRVVVPTGRQVAEVFAIRIALEPPAAQQAARRATAEEASSLTRVLERLMNLGDARPFAVADHQLHAQILAIVGNAARRGRYQQPARRHADARPLDDGRAHGGAATLPRSTPSRRRSYRRTRSRPCTVDHAAPPRHHGPFAHCECAAEGGADAWPAGEEVVETDL